MDVNDWRLGRLDELRQEIQEALDLVIGRERFELELEPATHPSNESSIRIHDLQHPGDEETRPTEYPEAFAHAVMVEPVEGRLGLEFMRPDWSYDGPYRFKELLSAEDLGALLVTLVAQLETGREYTLDPELWHYGANWDWETGQPIY